LRREDFGGSFFFIIQNCCEFDNYESHINEFRFMGQVSMETNNQNQQQLRNQVYRKTTIEPKNKQGKESREKRTAHQEMFTQFGPTTTMGESLISPIMYK